MAAELSIRGFQERMKREVGEYWRSEVTNEDLMAFSPYQIIDRLGETMYDKIEGILGNRMDEAAQWSEIQAVENKYLQDKEIFMGRGGIPSASVDALIARIKAQ
jgi:hypothetical protein